MAYEVHEDHFDTSPWTILTERDEILACVHASQANMTILVWYEQLVPARCINKT